MLKRILILLTIPAILLLAAACTSGDDENETPAVDTPEPVATATEEAVAPEEPDEEHLALSGDSFNPLELLSSSVLGMGSGTMGSAQGWEASGDVDPALKDSLLQLEDLPPGYGSLGVMEFSFSPDEGMLGAYGAQEGPLEMAAAMFFEGDMMTADIGTIVMSAAMVLPEDVMVEALSDFEEAASLDEEALAELEQAEAMYGIRYEDLRVLDASGLGETGVGLHMVMSFDGGVFAEMPGPNPFAAGMAMDAYVFLRGDKALMLATIWPADQASPLDSRSLAEVMDTRAIEAF